MPINPICQNCGAEDGVNYIAGVALCRHCKPPAPNTDIEEYKQYGQDRTTAETDRDENS